MRGSTEFPAMQATASRLWGPTSWWHPGGMAWQYGTQTAAGVMRTWGDLAWGWSYPDALLVQVDPAAPELAREVVAWFDEMNTGTAPRVEVADGDDHVVAALHDAGYAELPEEAFGLDQRAATEPAKVRLPRGYVLRTAEDVIVEVRVDAHRRAWLPSALPYDPDLRPAIDPDATSSFTADRLARVQNMPPYAAERDFVITTDAGEPAACCTVWFDSDTGSAEIEPLGVVPEHRRRGLAQALCRAALSAVAEAGGVEVVIHPRGDAAYPAPRGAYSAAGFRTVNRTRTYGKSVGA